MATSISYLVTDMRVTFPEGKVAEKNPERFATVHGSAFYAVDEKGKRGEKLSIVSKNIENEDATDPTFSLSLETGTLTLPEGRRGRKAAEGVSQDAIAERLAALAGK